MVSYFSHRELPASSRARLRRAAAQEFAARGFDGAKVDRIATRARVNKAMLYYHFGSKATLYREILRDLFRSAADAVAAVRQVGGPPERQVRSFIEAVAREAIAQPYFPPMWLREIAEGGRHLDNSVVAEMRRVVQTLAAMLKDGRRAGVFGAVPPLVAQLGIVAPLLVFAASAPLRERLGHLLPKGLARVSAETLMYHVQTMTVAALRVDARRRGRSVRSKAGARKGRFRP